MKFKQTILTPEDLEKVEKKHVERVAEQEKKVTVLLEQAKTSDVNLDRMRQERDIKVQQLH